MDVTIAALNSRFKQLQTYDTIFEFLFDLKKLNSLNDNKLKECCINIGNALKHDSFLDFDLNDLFFELKVLQVTLPVEKETILEIFEFVKILDCYPNVSIAYRILLTIPITVSFAKRSFSKLKLLKSYL